MGRNRRKRHKTRTEDDGSATSGTGDHQDGRCSQTVAGSSVIFTSSSPKTTSASSRQTSKATFTPSPSRINATDHASGSGSPRLSRDGPHSSQNQPQQRHDSPHSSQNHPQQRHDSLHSSQNQPQQRHDKRKKTKTTQSDVSVQSHKDLRYNSPSPQKRSRTSASDFENTCRSFSPRRRQKWGPGPEHTPPQKRGKTSTQSHRRGGKHHPGQFQHRQAAEAGRPYSSTKGKRRSDSASDSHQTSPASSLDIPGFYYDPEKQRYFKILPTSGNCNVVTKETIARDKAEAQRQKDLREFKSGASNTRSATQTLATASQSECAAPSVRKLRTCQTLGNALLGAYQRNEVSGTRLQKMFAYDSVSGLKPVGCADVFPDPQGIYEKLEHMHQMEKSRHHDKVLCLWSVRESVIQRLQLVTLRETPRTCPGHLSVEFDPSGTTVMQSWSKITNITWADMPQFPSKKYVLYTTMCHTGQAYSLAFIRNLDPEYGDDVHVSDFNLGTRATWTCAWNYEKQQFSVGTEKGCIVIDVNSRRLWQFKTHNSDALAQIFSREDGGSLMYTGTRRGQILLHDLRSSSTFPTTLMSHKSSLACLRLSLDETYLYASDFTGKINKWDLRMRRAVISYDGLYNQYTKLPFYIDETESILYGAGQDCYSKVWKLDTGKLVMSIPPPCQASRDTIPALQFSTHWAGRPGNAGLIMGVSDKFYLYGSGLEGDEVDSACREVVTDRWCHPWMSVITTR